MYEGSIRVTFDLVFSADVTERDPDLDTMLAAALLEKGPQFNHGLGPGYKFNTRSVKVAKGGGIECLTGNRVRKSMFEV